jgi:hypothetical protein
MSYFISRGITCRHYIFTAGNTFVYAFFAMLTGWQRRRQQWQRQPQVQQWQLFLCSS